MQSMFQRKVPELLQMNAIECGAACLAMILSHYGRKTSVAEVYKRTGVGRDGLSARSLVKAARSYGLKVKSISLDEASDFCFIHLPAIVFWQGNHFLVVERWSSSSVDVIDPALGRSRLSAEEFAAGLAGLAMMFEPDTAFSKKSSSKSMFTLPIYLMQYLKQSPGIFLQILGLSLLLQAFGLLIPLVTKLIIDQIIPWRMVTLLSALAVGLPLVLVVQMLFMLLRSFLLVSLQARVDTSLTSAFFDHLLKLPSRFFQQRSSGDILSRMASNTAVRNLISNQLLSTLLDGSMVVLYLGILLWQSFEFGVIALAIGLLQMLLLVGTRGSMSRLARRELNAIGESQGYTAEMLVGIDTIKASGAEQQAFQRWSRLFAKQLQASVRLNHITNVVSTFISMLNILAPLALLWIGTNAVLQGTMELGTMLALNVLAGAFLTPLTSLGASGQLLQVARSHIERLADVLEAEPEQNQQQVQLPPRLTGQITLTQVSFQYDANAPRVLKNIDIHIEAGQKIAIVGRTGSGKSTLGKLLLGLYLPTEGEIFYDNIPLKTLDFQAVRAQLGVVMQEAHTFSGSIRHNMTFSHPDVSMEQIVKATKTAALHEDILHMPMGYETFIAESGHALSGGQRQRLALACALVHEPAILLLDEATSSLDVVTEHTIEENLKQVPCTQIIIAHRLSTIRTADRILVLDEGRIVESGSHQELLAQEGYYANLIRNQLINGEAATVDASLTNHAIKKLT